MKTYRKVKATILDEVNKHSGESMNSFMANLKAKLGEDKWYTKHMVKRLIVKGEIKLVGDKVFPQLEYHVHQKKPLKYSLVGDYKLKLQPKDHRLALVVISPCGKVAHKHRSKNGLIDTFYCTKHPQEGMVKFLHRSEKFSFKAA